MVDARLEPGQAGVEVSAGRFGTDRAGNSSAGSNAATVTVVADPDLC